MSPGLAATLGPSTYWYLTRGTGVVSLLLLTASVVLGIVGTVGFTAPRWPRFAIDSLHRDISLLAIAFLVIHILVSVLDGFAPITLIDGVIPFVSAYRPLWMGLGTVAFDLMIALAITSLVRRRLGYRTWRAVHWLAYVSWPVAVLHGLGTGSDTQEWWMLAITAACLVAVLIAIWVRIERTGAEGERWRGPAIALTVIVPLGLAIFTLLGPLQDGWARRAGTPRTLLSKPVTAVVTPVSARRPATLKPPFSASLSGTISQTQEPGGEVIDILMNMAGGAKGKLRIRLAGQPIGPSGGLSMTGSQVDMVATGLPSVMEGQIVSLDGTDLTARVTGSAGSKLNLHANLSIHQQSDSVTGNLQATEAVS